MTRRELAEQIYSDMVARYMFDASPGLTGDYFEKQMDQFAEASIVAAKAFVHAANEREMV